MTLTSLGVTWILCSYKLVLEGKASKVLRKVFCKHFGLSEAWDNTSGPLIRGGIVDLPFLRALLAIPQNLWEPGFWSDTLFCFISITKFGSFKNPFSTIAGLSEFLFRCRRFVLFLQTKELIYELWQQHKLLKTTEIDEAWLDIYVEGYIH